MRYIPIVERKFVFNDNNRQVELNGHIIAVKQAHIRIQSRWGQKKILKKDIKQMVVIE